MKIKTLLAFISIFMLTMIQSCSNDPEPVKHCLNETETIISHMVIKFEGKVYETDVKTIADSVIYLNQEYAEVYNTKISKLPDLATVVSTDDMGIAYVEYFASQIEVMRSYNILRMEEKAANIDSVATRSKIIDLWPGNQSGTVLGFAGMFDDVNFSDTMLVTYATNAWVISVPKLKSEGFNDKCSSIKVYNNMNPNDSYTVWFTDESTGIPQNKKLYGRQLRPILVSYADSDYKGKVLYCIAPQTGSTQEHFDSNLKTIGWNDKISSISWQLVTDYRQFIEDNPNAEHSKC